jgi:hypothetical protein
MAGVEKLKPIALPQDGTRFPIAPLRAPSVIHIVIGKLFPNMRCPSIAVFLKPDNIGIERLKCPSEARRTILEAVILLLSA